MLLRRFTMGRMPGLAKVVCSTIALLRFLEVVAVPRPHLYRVSLGLGGLLGSSIAHAIGHRF
jgi:hypothetical protein